jgi:hypothetical protein
MNHEAFANQGGGGCARLAKQLAKTEAKSPGGRGGNIPLKFTTLLLCSWQPRFWIQ